MSRLIAAAAVAEMTGTTEADLSTWRRRGDGPASFKLNGRVVYDEDLVRAWIERHHVVS